MLCVHCNVLSILLINLLVAWWSMDAMKRHDIQTRYSEIIWSALQVGGYFQRTSTLHKNGNNMREMKNIKDFNNNVKLQCTSWQTNSTIIPFSIIILIDHLFGKVDVIHSYQTP